MNRVGRRYLVGLITCFFCTLSFGQSVGNCESPLGEAYLEANNVRARIPNTGGLFYRGEPHVYRVPRFLTANAIFSGAIWVAGLVDGQIHASATRYGPWEFWAGPLDEQGNPPANCDLYDRVYSVSRSDLDIYENAGSKSQDLAEWPTGLGAPTLDGIGKLIDLIDDPFSTRKNRIINLAAGERPALKGDQAVWWVMNDRGNAHESTHGPPIGLELHGHAYGIASTKAAINNSTIYNYRGFYRGASRIDSLYFGLWIDHDLGNFGDDYMGSDSLLGMGYAYNADNFDEGGEGYGTPPPALGLMLLQGPAAAADGLDNNRNGLTDESGERAHVAHVMRVNKSSRIPQNGEEYYNHLRGRWNTGRRMTLGGLGDDFPGTPVNYAFPGDPVTGEFWSMVNFDGAGTALAPLDFRFLVSVGPLALEPGEEFDLTFAIVWAIGEDHLDSVTELKKAAIELKTAFDGGFSNIEKGRAPVDSVPLVSPGNGGTNQPYTTTLRWTPIDYAEAYDISLWTTDTTLTYRSLAPSLYLKDLEVFQRYFWTVRGVNVFGFSPFSDVWSFETGDVSFVGLTPIFSQFQVVQNAAGPLDPPDMAALAFSSPGFPRVPCRMDSDELCSRPTRGYQQSSNSSRWGIHAGGAKPAYGPVSDSLSFLGRVTRMGANLDAIGQYDYEIRFTNTPGLAFILGTSNTINVPFELWNIGETSLDNHSDDYRMIPVLCESACSAGTVNGVFDIGGDHLISGSLNDPATDYFSWMNPSDTSPGDLGYYQVITGSSDPGDEVLSNMVLVQWNGGDGPPYDVSLPETGTIFRISTAKPPPPILAAPSQDTEFLPGNISFYWSGTSMDVFRVQIADSPGFESSINDSDSADPNWDVVLEIVGTYYWRVKGYGSDWSETWSFNIVESLRDDSDSPFPIVSSLSNYPNPTRANATIAFDLFTPLQVRIDVYDLLGRRVIRLLDHELNPGRHRIPLDVTNFPSGVYFYRFQAGQFTETKSMIVVK